MATGATSVVFSIIILVPFLRSQKIVSSTWVTKKDEFKCSCILKIFSKCLQSILQITLVLVYFVELVYVT